jgi:hypothetical protein
MSPKVASASTGNEPERKVIRFTLDLDFEQHKFLKLFSLENGVQSSVVMRTLLLKLETDKKLREKILNMIFSD